MGTLDCITYSSRILSVLCGSNMEGFLMQQIYHCSYDFLSWGCNTCDGDVFGVSCVSLECLHFPHTPSQLIEMQVTRQSSSQNSTFSMESSLVLQVKTNPFSSFNCTVGCFFLLEHISSSYIILVISTLLDRKQPEHKGQTLFIFVNPASPQKSSY